MGKIQRGGVVDAAYAIVSIAFWSALLFGAFNVIQVALNGPDGVTVANTLVRADGAELSAIVILTAATWAVGAFLLFMLRAIVLSVKTGNPFSESNVKRLRILAGLFLAGPLLAMGEAAIVSEYVGGFRISLGRWMQDLLVGFVVLVLAEVFAQGVRLRTDVEGTV